MMEAAEPRVSAPETDILRWFAAVFAHEPTAEQIEAYRSGAAEPFLVSLAVLTSDPAPVDRLRAAIGALRSRSPREHAIIFTELFLLPEPSSAIPVASLYSGEARFGGRTELRMRARLDRAGFSPGNAAGLPADHLSIMLELLAHSIDHPDLKTIHTELLDELGAGWLEQVRTGIERRGAKAELYSAAMDALQALLQHEYDRARGVT